MGRNYFRGFGVAPSSAALVKYPAPLPQPFPRLGFVVLVLALSLLLSLHLLLFLSPSSSSPRLRVLISAAAEASAAAAGGESHESGEAAGKSGGAAGNSMAAAGIYSIDFLVDTPGCRIPRIDPWDPSILHLVAKGASVECSFFPDPLTAIRGGKIVVDKVSAKRNFANFGGECRYSEIIRGDDDTQWFLGEPIRFRDEASVFGQFYMVSCFDPHDEVIYDNFHYQILPDERRTRRKSEQRRRRIEAAAATAAATAASSQAAPNPLPVKVLMIGLDSVSRLNFHRQMPRLRRLLLEDLKGVELDGYNKVADNTFVNLVPMFAGKFVEELNWSSETDEPFDSVELAWKRFAGYTTLFAEDAPKIAIFNYLKKGFVSEPADHYLRPFSLAVEYSTLRAESEEHCVGNRLETGMVLDYVDEFLRVYNREPTFAFAFLTRLTHDDVNRVGAADEPHFRFLRRQIEAGTLNDTVVIYFSDHGLRFGDFRETTIGKLEERLPFFVVALPDSLRRRFPGTEKNLRRNAGRLATPFDVHQTLEEIMRMAEGTWKERKGGRTEARGRKEKKKKKMKRGFSLLGEIPIERTCEDAAILPHWCCCHAQTPLDVTRPEVALLVRRVIDDLNDRTKSRRRLCAQLNLLQITHAVAARPWGGKGPTAGWAARLFGARAESPLNYLVSFVTHPGEAHFEATVTVDNGDAFDYQAISNARVAGDVSRINEYASQSACVEEADLKKFCFCDTSGDR